MVLAIAAEYKLECWQLEYNTAFLNADFTEEVYVKMAPRYEQFDENRVPLVIRLLKSLYGLRQSPTRYACHPKLLMICSMSQRLSLKKLVPPVWALRRVCSSFSPR